MTSLLEESELLQRLFDDLQDLALAGSIDVISTEGVGSVFTIRLSGA